MEGEPAGSPATSTRPCIAGGSADARCPQVDENAIARALLHERHDRPAQGRRAQPAVSLPARPRRRDRAGLPRGRRGAPRRPPLPRQRVGRPPLRDHDRRAPRHAPQVRADGPHGGGSAPPGHAPARRARDLQRPHPPQGSVDLRPVEPPAGHHRRLHRLAGAHPALEEGLGVQAIVGYGLSETTPIVTIALRATSWASWSAPAAGATGDDGLADPGVASGGGHVGPGRPTDGEQIARSSSAATR